MNTLRAYGDAIPVDGTTADAEAWTLRVQSAEAWDAVRVLVRPSTRVLDVKRAAMAALLPDLSDVDAQEVKLRGVLVRDEQRSLEQVGAQDGSTLLLVSRRRQPVR